MTRAYSLCWHTLASGLTCSFRFHQCHITCSFLAALSSQFCLLCSFSEPAPLCSEMWISRICWHHFNYVAWFQARIRHLDQEFTMKVVRVVATYLLERQVRRRRGGPRGVLQPGLPWGLNAHPRPRLFSNLCSCGRFFPWSMLLDFSCLRRGCGCWRSASGSACGIRRRHCRQSLELCRLVKAGSVQMLACTYVDPNYPGICV